jgi:O-acetylhomoserine/O-acetylserine sulfhydrylase-like pyridoxal-dependent enzyme
MAIAQAMCTSFKAEILDEQHDLVADTIKIALYTSSASLGAGTTAYSTTNEITGTGYTAGGVALSSKTVDTSGTTAYFDSADPSWTSATFTANGALIYNDTNSDKAIAVLAFGGDFTVAGGTFQIVFPAAGANAIVRID